MKRVIIVLLIIDILLISFVKFDVIDVYVEAHNDDFGMSFVRKSINSNEGNILVSPYSVELALRMLMEGASGSTKSELLNVLNERTVNDVTSSRVLISNGLFIKDKYRKGIDDKYVSNILNSYGGEVLIDEFRDPHVINEWVDERTNHMIPGILDSVDPSFVLGLANAIALDLEWYMPFSCESTKKGTFTKNDGSTYNVSMMHDVFNDDYYGYFDNESEKGIVLPYGLVDEKKYEFVGIIPDEDINSYVKKMDLERILKSKKMASEDVYVHLSLPRFSYDYSLDDFASVIKSMGINKVFDKNDAEFYKIISKENLERNGWENLYIGQAIHKTHIDLNEKGTKAAAVTFFGLFATSSAMINEKNKDVYITFDKPFIYLIREVESNEILFFGVVNEPDAWEGSTCDE